MEKTAKEKHLKSWKKEDGSFSARMFLNENDVVQVLSIGIQDKESCNKLIALCEEMHTELGSRYPILIDAIGLTDNPPESRSIMGAYTISKDSPFTKVAIVAVNNFQRTVFNMYTRISKKPIKMFRDIEEAGQWLKEEI